MPGPFVHDIDPIIGSVGGVHLWWYGLAYSLGFLTVFLALRAKRAALGFSVRMVYDLSILAAIGVLIGGRFIEVVFYEWPFYREHLHLIPAYWLGGMATHGLLLGGMVAVVLFCRAHRLPILTLTDALAVPVAFILGFGRLGNFIDGQIVGSPTLTHKHAHDFEVLEQLIYKPFRYLGMIGSKTKVVTVLQQLRAKGVSEDIINKIHSPIGISIGAHTPAEIAISIAAEIVAVRNNADVSALTLRLDK